MFELFPIRRNNKNMLNEVNSFEKSVLDFFQRDFGSFFENASVKTDIIEKKDHYLVQAELPGFDKKDINIEINDDKLLISAKYEDSLKEENDNYIRKERKMNSYKRVFDVSDIKKDSIDAKYDNGVLELKLPKKDDKIKKTKKIDIK